MFEGSSYEFDLETRDLVIEGYSSRDIKILGEVADQSSRCGPEVGVGNLFAKTLNRDLIASSDNDCAARGKKYWMDAAPAERMAAAGLKSVTDDVRPGAYARSGWMSATM